MPRPPKQERNTLIYQLYKPHKHGYKKLGKQFSLSYWTVRDIVERERERDKERLGKTH